jgi:uncharacterized DUF497 family protein
MQFEWDEAKNKQNIKKHGLDLADAAELFTGSASFLVNLDARHDHGEDRWKGIGIVQGVVVVVVVFTERDDDRIRVISLRKANSWEKKTYEEEIKNRLGAG